MYRRKDFLFSYYSYSFTRKSIDRKTRNAYNEGVMMRISTKGRYAVRIMLDLAQHAAGDPVSLRDVAERQRITPKYMESIMSLLLREGMVVSSRGKAGGYRLARPAEEYTVYDILCAAEGDLAPVACLSQVPQGCELAARCATLPVWRGLDEVIRGYLSGVRLSELAEGDTTPCAEM